MTDDPNRYRRIQADRTMVRPRAIPSVGKMATPSLEELLGLAPSETSVIPPEREAEFRAWIRRNNIRDLDSPHTKYDYRGAFLSGVGSEISAVDNLPHWPDTFKQHGHPTFSVESQYSRGSNDGGTWGGPDGETFTPGRGQGVFVGRPIIASVSKGRP